MDYRLLIFGLLILIASACETVVDIDLPERDASLVLNSRSHPDSVFVFNVSASKSVLEGGPLPQITNATIDIFGSDGSQDQIVGSTVTNNDKRERYRAQIKPQYGVEYTISVRAPEYNPITAVSTVPNPVRIISIDTSSTISDGEIASQLLVTFDDPAELGNYYDLKLYFYYTSIDTAGGQFKFVPVVQEIPYSLADVGIFNGFVSNTTFSDEAFNGRRFSYTIIFDDFQLRLPDNPLLSLLPTYLIAELRSISDDYYLYERSFDDYQSSSFDPFAQPVQVHSNVEGGFGVFAPYSVDRDSIDLTGN